MSTKAYGHEDKLGYGYYWWIGNYKNGDELLEAIIAAGFGGQSVIVIPELNLIAVFTSKPDDNTKEHNRISKIMEKYILPSMLASGP